MAPLGGIQRGVSRPGLSSSIAGKTEEGNLEVSGRRGCCDHCGNQPSHGRPPNADEIDCHRRLVQDRAYCDAREPDDLLGPVAYSVAALFADLDRRKIRKCSNCVLHFFDTSKKGTRRWCSSAYPLTPHGSQETGNLDHHKNGHGPHAIRWPAAISESPETAAGSAARKSSTCETARRFGLRKHCVGSQRHGLGSDSMPNSGTTR